MQGSGISSESIWTAFDSTCTANVRQPKFRVYVAWTRIANVENYFTIGTSTIGGTDIIAGSDVASINNADAFEYFDETDNVISVEYERYLNEPLGGTAIAMADIVFDNTDSRFTPDYNSTIGTALRPNRPIKVFIGFEVLGQEKLIPILEGLTTTPPIEDKNKRVARLQVYDFMRWLNQKPLESQIYQNKRTDEIIADILASAGVGSSNYELSEGLNTISFAWFEKGQTAGDRIRKLCESEDAVFYQDETGKFRFKNRNRYNDPAYYATPWGISPDDILEWQTNAGSRTINRCIVKAKPRSVKGETEVWKNGIEEEIGIGETLTIWANFENPVDTLTQPAETTDYTAYSATMGGGSDVTTDVDITMTSFTKAAKLEITNNSGGTAYVNFLRLRGTPATIDYDIEQVFEDTNSISDYNEAQYILENDFIDSRTFASSIAQGIVRRYKNPKKWISIVIRGVPQLQLDDFIGVADQDQPDSDNTTYRLIKIQGTLTKGGFTQKLLLRLTNDEDLS